MSVFPISEYYTLTKSRFAKILRNENICRISIRSNYILLICEFQGKFDYYYLFFPSPQLDADLHKDLFFNIMEFDSEFGFAWDIHTEWELHKAIVRLTNEINQFTQTQQQLDKLIQFRQLNQSQHLLSNVDIPSSNNNRKINNFHFYC